MYCRYCGALLENGTCKACKLEREKREYSKTSFVLCLASFLIPLFGILVGIFNITNGRKKQGIIYLVCVAIPLVFYVLIRYVPPVTNAISEFISGLINFE